MDCKGKQDRYQARIARTAEDVRAAQQLRYTSFLEGHPAGDRGVDVDEDAFDTRCDHVLILDQRSGAVVATFRLLLFSSGAEIDQSYSAQFYDLEALSVFPAPMAELGRFCVAPDCTDPDVLRVAWSALASFVENKGVQLIFGCSSFQGTDESVYADAFAMLRDKHLAPKKFWPRVKAPNVFKFAARLRRAPNQVRALRSMPPLLRSYLNMGGWVSDHAVIDDKMNTLHVFTGLEIGRIPPGRARVLRAVIG